MLTFCCILQFVPVFEAFMRPSIMLAPRLTETRPLKGYDSLVFVKSAHIADILVSAPEATVLHYKRALSMLP